GGPWGWELRESNDLERILARAMIDSPRRNPSPTRMDILSHRRALRVLAIFISALPAIANAAAPAWQPKHLFEIEVGVTPGGPLDISARLMQRIARERKLAPVPMIVMNRPGANNALAWIYLNQHAGDAHYI